MSRPCALRFPFSIRSLPLAFVLTLALTLTSASIAAADGIIIPHPPPDQPIPWRDVPLTIKYHRVDVTIVDQVATTKVDQVFVNEAELPGRGHLHLPAARGRRHLELRHVGGRPEAGGQAAGPRRGPRIYEDIVRSQRDPALLEYVGRGAFQASIFPIPPGGERRIELTYSQVLPQTAGLVHYRYPLNTEKFSSRPSRRSPSPFTWRTRRRSAAIYSPSHPVEVVRDGDRRATVSYEAQNVRPDRDFDLYYSLSTDAVAVNLLSYKPYDEDGFFLLLVTPPVEAAGQARRQGRDAGAGHLGQHGRREDDPGEGRRGLRAGSPGRGRPLQHRRVQHGHAALQRPARARGAPRRGPRVRATAWRRRAAPTSTGRCWRRWRAPMRSGRRCSSS